MHVRKLVKPCLAGVVLGVIVYTFATQPLLVIAICLGESILLGAIAYITGSLPCGFRICKWLKGNDFDIRKYLTGNVGFTNVLRVLGFGPAMLVLAADIAKSFVPVYLANLAGFHDIALIAGILAAGFGHGYSIFMYRLEGKFSGGKSVATFLGGFLGAQPGLAGLAFLVWLVVLLATRYMFLASIMGGVMALAASLWLRKGITWNAACLIVVGYLTFKHIPNISRFLQHNELRMFTEGRRGEVVVAFGIHPRDAEDLKQSPLIRMLSGHILNKEGVFDIETLKRICDMGIVLECGKISGIITYQGIHVRVLIYGFPFMPDDIKAEENEDLLLDWLKLATVAAESRGATGFGMGGLLSTKSRVVSRLKAWLEENGHTIELDNGAAYTAWATKEAAEQKVAEMGLVLSDMVMADVGAKGFIGRPVGQSFAGKVRDILPVIRKKEAKSDDPIDFGSLATTDDISNLKQADLVVLATSSPKPIITPENVGVIKDNAIVLDVAYPVDFDERALEERPDITLVRCGLILLPGDPGTNLDLHFGHVMVEGVKRFLVPACLAQVIMLGITQAWENSSSMMVRPDHVEFFGQVAKEHGLQVIVSAEAEPDIYAGKMEVAA